MDTWHLLVAAALHKNALVKRNNIERTVQLVFRRLFAFQLRMPYSPPSLELAKIKQTKKRDARGLWVNYDKVICTSGYGTSVDALVTTWAAATAAKTWGHMGDSQNVCVIDVTPTKV